MGAFRYAQESSARNRTVGALGAIQAALELYKEKFGEYPEAEAPLEVDTFSGDTLHVGGAHMLYQAITADGSSAIKLATTPEGGVSESDGRVSDMEKENSISASPLPKSIIYPPNVPAGTMRPRILVDGWGRPFQYTKADPDPNHEPVTVNPTYDLWSFGPLKSKSLASDSLDLKKDPEASASWIKNW